MLIDVLYYSGLFLFIAYCVFRIVVDYHEGETTNERKILEIHKRLNKRKSEQVAKKYEAIREKNKAGNL